MMYDSGPYNRMAIAPRLVHPLTLRFDNGELERAYAERAFAESYPTFVFGTALLALLGLLAIFLPGAEPAPVTVAVLLALLCARTWLHHENDEVRFCPSSALFGWVWGALLSLWAGIVLRGRDVPYLAMSNYQFWFVVALSTLIESWRMAPTPILTSVTAWPRTAHSMTSGVRSRHARCHLPAPRRGA